LEDSINKSDLSPFDTPVRRFKYWINRYLQDVDSEKYKDWVDNVRVSRHFRQNELEDAMADMGAESLLDEDYWYKDCGASRVESFYLGQMLGSRLNIVAKEDTADGARETDISRGIADLILDKFKSGEFEEEASKFGGDYAMDGMGYISVRLDGGIDPDTGAPRVLVEHCDSLEFVLDCRAQSLRQINHLFRKRRRAICDLKLDFPGQNFKSDSLEDYYNFEHEGQNDERREVEAGIEPLADLLEVEFRWRERVRYYTLPPEAANALGVDELLTEDEYNALTETLFEGVTPAEWIEVQLMLESGDSFEAVVEKYYTDCFFNGKSLYPEGPRLSAHDESITPNGFSYSIINFKSKANSPYGYGLIYYHRDKMVIVIMLITLFMRQASRVNLNRSYHMSTMYDEDEQRRIMEGAPGPVWVKGPPKEAEYRPHTDDLEVGLLQSADAVVRDIEYGSGVLKELSGQAPFAQAPAAGIDMLIRSGSTLFVDPMKRYFRKMSEVVKKYYLQLRENAGLLEIPDVQLEIDYDFRTPAERDAEGLKAMNMYQAGLLNGETVLRKNGFENAREILQSRQLEDLGKMVQGNPELAALVQNYIQTQKESNQAGG